MKKAHQKKNKNQSNVRKQWRYRVLQVGGVLILAGFSWRVYDIQQVYGKTLQNDEQKYVDVKQVTLAHRGSIQDSQGQLLAYDIPAYHLDIHTSSLQQYGAKVASVIAPILGTTQQTVLTLIEGNYKWARWKSIVTETTRKKIETAFQKHAWAPNENSVNWSADVTFTPTEKRVYPYGDFAANVLGYLSTNNQAQGGVESEFNKYLAGTGGLVQYQRDASGFPMPGTQTVIKKVTPGDNVQLTLNGNIQGYVEYQMNALVKKFKPQHAAIIVTNPQTGAILAMSSRPTFNPNSYWQASIQALSQNWAVSSSFEPGSTFKPFVLAAGLATHSITLQHKYMSGHMTLDGHTINDWNYGNGWGVLTYQQALEKSSNVGFAHIALSLGWPNLIHYMNLFGFTKPTGVDLPNEANPLIFPPSQRQQLELATSGFGQGIAVTPMEQMAAMGVIANGGKLMKPYIVKKIETPTGKAVKSYQPTVVRSGFISQKVLNEVKQTMVLDVSGKDGIDTAAKIPGYQVAGKTGTAQIVNPKTHQYYSNRFITSFMGFAPAQHPTVEVYVTVDYPKAPVAKTWGSTISAPYAKKIMKYCLDYDHIPPTGAVKNVASYQGQKSQVTYVQSPNITGLAPQAAKQKLTQVGLKPTIVGTGGTIQRQLPQAGIELVKGSAMYGITGSSIHGNKVRVPSLTGLSLKTAVDLLDALSLNVKLSGSGYVVKQSISAGRVVNTGTTLDITLKP